MLDKPLKGPLNLQYTPEQQAETASAAPSEQPRPEVGPSSLIGRRGDNMTLHTQGAYKEGYNANLWGWAWKDLAAAFLGLLRVFTPTRRK
ncbi:MAG: hypothetical protein B193_0526 [Solidesulfovibrio magneticus str. Maddingley MBC34]|uniref:Uncharacterized protein n=1 Tax=Solidesulfovibrio magneticus str. Maddingley MBC34 TaxID=1206767 RepID=K6GUW9_9BACT|nr:MAG: hypothetical protein B193_0526 [Solidesulfovibrio magneticus str. Maddingley MBC34]